jgi:hypothetical protein
LELDFLKFAGAEERNQIFAMGKHSSLFCLAVCAIDKGKKRFISLVPEWCFSDHRCIGAGVNISKLFVLSLSPTVSQNKLECLAIVCLSG